MSLPEEATLVVFEVYFPNREAFDHHYEDILGALRQVEIQ
jgi:hypothetical protein